jgi:hypothetical protein
MLDGDYLQRLDSVIKQLNWQIQLPENWSSFFLESGEYSTYAKDERRNRRVKVRTVALMHYERMLPSYHRNLEIVGTYTRDFSRRGCGFVAANQLFPREIVRILLPTLWLRLEVTRATRFGPSCYVIGGELLEQNQPSDSAFNDITIPATFV